MTDDALTRLMRTARTRAMAASLLAGGARGLGWGAALLLVAALCHRFLAPLPALVPAVLLLVPLLAGLAAGWRRRPDATALAQALDRRFDARSLIATAWSVRDAPTMPAAMLVLDDARTRAPQWQARLRAALPVGAPRSAAVSATAVLAAALLLAHPGAPPRNGVGAGAESGDAAAPPAGQSRGGAQPAGHGPTARTSGAAADTAADATDADVMSARSPRRGTRETPAMAGAGDAPGHAAADGDARTAHETGLDVTWIGRERHGAGAGGAAPDPGAAAMADAALETATAGVPSAAARNDVATYEPVLPPAVAAYARAVARAESVR